MTYDSRCYDLAELFLAEYPSAKKPNIKALAAEIQKVIEDFCADFDDERAAEP